jgi:hypothetical protein
MNRTWKTFRYVLIGGVCLQWATCIQAIINNLPVTLLLEFLTDNNAVFDLFTDN